MSCIGIDIGCLNSVIAVARNRGVDIICNEVSNRATPSMVTFGPKNRFIGESAKTQEISNFKSSVSCLKRLLGLKAGSDDLQFEIEKQFINCPAELTDEGVYFSINFNGEQRRFSAVEVLAMFLGKLRETAHADVNVAVNDVVLAVPVFFEERQRRALFDAAEIAGLTVTRMISEPAALAISYGMPKTDIDSERLVCFVDLGYSATTVSITSFTKGKAEIKSVVFSKNLGGRDFDMLLTRSFASELAQKGVDLSENRRALFRLRLGCEKTKKVLSANQVAVLNVENLANDRDFTSQFTRQSFEESIIPLLKSLEDLILSLFSKGNFEISNIHSVEIVGGSSRIPAIKDLLRRIFGKESCTTLNQDEAIARGCALQSALLSPTFKVREFSVTDVNLFDRVFTWTPLNESDGEAKAFPIGNTVPSTKLLSFEPRPPNNGNQVDIGKAIVEGKALEDAVLKVKVRLNPNNLISFEGVSLPEGSEGNVKITFSSFLNLPKPTIEKLKEQEGAMMANDKLVADTAERKNALEAYIYEMRNNLNHDGGSLYKFTETATAEKLLMLCSSTEEWLYSEEGEDAKKSVYVEKLKQLEKLGEPIIKRAVEFEQRPQAENSLRSSIAEYEKMIGSPLYDHIPSEELIKAREFLNQSLAWLNDGIVRQSQTPLYQDPKLTCSSIREEREKLISKLVPIMSKPRPKPTPTSTSSTPQNSEGASKASSSEQPMDVDQGEGCQDECCGQGGCCGNETSQDTCCGGQDEFECCNH
jgi:heat shock 70kDa protein 4